VCAFTALILLNYNTVLAEAIFPLYVLAAGDRSVIPNQSSVVHLL